MSDDLLAQAKSGDAEAQFRLAERFAGGRAGPRDFEQGIYWLERAAEQDHPRALATLGGLRFHGRHCPPNPEQGLDLIRRAASLGYTDALNSLGTLYSDQKNPIYDKAKALDYFRQAAEADDYYGQFNCALHHELDGNFQEAVKWYRRAVEQNHDTAHYRLAGLLADGKGAPQNIDEACELYDFAGDELQYPLGYYGYARLHDDPKYGRQDLETAAGFYFLAADKGIAEAQLRYAELAELGYGDPEAPNDAYVWVRVALEHLTDIEDIARGEALLARLKTKLGPWQLAEAEREASGTIAFLREYGRC